MNSSTDTNATSRVAPPTTEDSPAPPAPPAPTSGKGQGPSSASSASSPSTSSAPSSASSSGVADGPPAPPSTCPRPLYASGRVVASLDSDGTLRRVVRSNHILRSPPAIAFDASVIATAESLGCRHIVCDVSGDSYAVTMRAFRHAAVPLNRGHGEQLAMPLHAWTVTSADAYTMPLQGFGSDDAE